MRPSPPSTHPYRSGMLRSASLVAALLLTACGTGTSTRDGDGSTRPRNAVFIVIDTLRADHLGCYGYERPTTPNLDRFAADAVLFEQAYCQAPWTVSSVASIMSSLYPQTHGVTHASDNRPLPDSIETLAETLDEGAWKTAAFTANELLLDETGLYQGFDEHLLVPIAVEGEPHADAADKVNRFALPWLEANHAEPFFLYLHYMDPHDPYTDPAGYHEQFDPDYAGSFDGSIGHIFDAMARNREWHMSERDIHNMRARYDGEILYVDEKVQEVFDTLDRLGIADDTVVIVAADHGEQFFEHGSLKHGTTIYQEEVRVPLIIRSPGAAAAGSRISQPVATVDVLPTVLDLLGLDAPQRVHGKSLVPFLRGEPMERGDVYTETAHGWLWQDRRVMRNKVPIMAVIRDSDKLITVPSAEYEEDNPGISLSVPDELYDLAADPRENDNLASSRKADAEKLHDDVATWRAQARADLIEARSFTTAERKALQERLARLGYTSKKPEDDEAEENGSHKKPEDDEAEENGSHKKPLESTEKETRE